VGHHRTNLLILITGPEAKQILKIVYSLKITSICIFPCAKCMRISPKIKFFISYPKANDQNIPVVTAIGLGAGDV